MLPSCVEPGGEYCPGGTRTKKTQNGYKAWCKNSRFSFLQNGTKVTIPQPYTVVEDSFKAKLWLF